MDSHDIATRIAHKAIVSFDLEQRDGHYIVKAQRGDGPQAFCGRYAEVLTAIEAIEALKGAEHVVLEPCA